MTPYQPNRFLGDGTKTSFEFYFPGGYLSKDHVTVKLEQSPNLPVTVPFAWLNDFTVSLTTAPPIGSTLIVARNTPHTVPLVDYTTGARLTEKNLDESNAQAIFAIAELYAAAYDGQLTASLGLSSWDTTFVVTPGQTDFVLPASFVPAGLQVYANGVRQQGVSILSPTSFRVLGLSAGDEVFVQVWGPSFVDGTNPEDLTGSAIAAKLNTYLGNAIWQTGSDNGAQIVSKINAELGSADWQTGGGGGGGTVASDVTTALGNRLLNQDTPNSRIVFGTIPANGWNVAAGRCVADFEFTATNYFSQGAAHFAAISRCTTDLVGVAARGTGVAAGHLATASGYAKFKHDPVVMLESWVNGIGPNGQGNWLLPRSECPQQLVDGVRYRIQHTSTTRGDGLRTTRYRLWQWQAERTLWLHMYDTGDVLDPNEYADLTQTGLVFGSVFHSGSWQVMFNNIKVTWGAPEESTTEATNTLTRDRADLEGDLRFINGDLRLSNPSADPANWTRIRNRDSGDTSFLVTPTGAGTRSSVIVTAHTSPTSIGYAAVTCATDNKARLNTSAIGGAITPILAVGYNGTDNLLFNSAGVSIAGASRALNTETGVFGGAVGLMDTTAVDATNAPFSFANVVAHGAITSILGGGNSVSAAQVEYVTRVLYAYISVILKLLQDKKVI